MTRTPLERLSDWEQRHDTAMPDGLLYPQTPAERARGMALANLRLAADFVRIATEMMAVGQTDSANVSIGDALYHLNMALGNSNRQAPTPIND